MLRISVDFPAPLGPSRPKHTPSTTGRETPVKAVTSPKRLVTELTNSAGCGWLTVSDIVVATHSLSLTDKRLYRIAAGTTDVITIGTWTRPFQRCIVDLKSWNGNRIAPASAEHPEPNTP